MTLKSNRASVLAGITGSFPCGSLVALMGPSGGGKTTFMNALLGRAAYGNVTGDITVNGVKGGLTSVPSLVGFVPQVMTPPLPPSPVGGGAAPPPLLLTVACRPPSRRLRAAGRHRPPKPDRLREPLLPRDDAAAAQDLQGGQGAPRRVVHTARSVRVVPAPASCPLTMVCPPPPSSPGRCATSCTRSRSCASITSATASSETRRGAA